MLTRLLLLAAQELSSSAAISSPDGTSSTPMALPSEASMFSSSLRTMAWCSLLSAISWSTCRRELSAARRSADESSDSPAMAARPSIKAALASGNGMPAT